MELLLGGGTQLGLIVVFLIAALLIILSGLKLGDYGDALGERTGIGGGIVGLIFLALVTSLPDLTVSVSAAITATLSAATASVTNAYNILKQGADLGAGNLVGSNLFNLLIFAIIDITQGKGALLFRLSRKHILSAVASLFMMGLLIFGFAINQLGDDSILIPFLDCGAYMLLIPIAYIWLLKLVGNLENSDHGLDASDYEVVETDTKEYLLHMSGTSFYSRLIILSAVIVLSGVWLSQIGDRMASPVASGGFGLSATIVGTVFLAIATSLPEMVVSIAAVRIGAFDMAAGNILGSNIFNIAGLFLVDCALRGKPLLDLISIPLLVTMIMVILMTCVIIMGLIVRSRRSLVTIGLDVWLVILLYIIGNISLYIFS